MFNMDGLMKQAQKMQAEMAKAREEAKKQIVDGMAGGGAVKVRINGAFEVLEVKISPEAVDPDDIELLEDLVAAAFSQALAKVKDGRDSAMKQATGGLDLGGFFGG